MNYLEHPKIQYVLRRKNVRKAPVSTIRTYRSHVLDYLTALRLLFLGAEVGDDRGGVNCLKLSPNLRGKVTEEVPSAEQNEAEWRKSRGLPRPEIWKGSEQKLITSTV